MLTLNTLIHLFLENINVSLYALVILICIIDRRRKSKISNSEIMFRWLSLIYLGGTYLFAGIEHLTLGNFANALQGNIMHSYHFELAGLNLIFALIAIGGFKAGFGYRIAIALFSALISWFDIGAHVFNSLHFYGYQSMDIAQVLDVAVPFILICCLPKLQPK